MATLLEDSVLIEQGDFYCDFVRQNEWRGSRSVYGAIVDVLDETAQGNQELTTFGVALSGFALLHLCPEFSYVITENVRQGVISLIILQTLRTSDDLPKQQKSVVGFEPERRTSSRATIQKKIYCFFRNQL